MTSGIMPSGWTRVGQSRTSPVDNKKRAEVTLDSYYVVVGFEVNFPKAFVNDVLDLHVDYGHAFFYLVKNAMIKKSFSFGPDETGKTGWFDQGEHVFGRNIYDTGAVIKDGHKDSRHATPDFRIKELVKAFKIPLSLVQARTLELMIDKYRRKILDGEEKYNVMLNDTCAAMAKKVLESAEIPTPSGRGLVKYAGVIDYAIVHATNPYKWYQNFRGKYREALYPPVSVDWLPPIGKADPIFGQL